MSHVLSRRAVLSSAASFAVLPASSSAQVDALPAPTASSSAPRHATHRRGGFELTRFEVRLEALHPAHDGLVVAQLSDLHVGWQTPAERIIGALEAVREAKPDLLVLTGDFVTWSARPIPRVTELLRDVGVPAFACLGNHDHLVDAQAVRTALERSNVTVLQNAHTVTSVRGAPLGVVGIDDGATRHDDVGRALRGSEKLASRLVLTHAPPTSEKLPPDAGLLCLTGHTHGGGVHVPRVTESLFRLFRQPFVRGLYEVNSNRLYVNRGLGFGANALAPRAGATPEVALVRLRRVDHGPSGTL